VVGGDTVANQTVRSGESIEEVDADVKRSLVLAQDVSGINAGWSGSNNRKS
jgi:hypothetical protein